MLDTTPVLPLPPLAKKLVAGHHGAAGGAGIVLHARTVRDLWQIAGWDGFEAAAAPVLSQLGLDGTGSYRHAQQARDATAWRIAPDKILIEGAGDLRAFGSAELAVLDLSHARTVITLSGHAARDLLAQVVAIDLSPLTFGPGEFLQTGIHHVGVLIHCTDDDRFNIFVPGTWAESVWEVLCHNGAPHGYEVIAE